MSEYRTIHDPFLGKDVQIRDNLSDCLRGKYACGPMLPNGEPEFGWRQFDTPPIQHRAADRIDALVVALQAAQGQIMNAKIDLQTGHTKAAGIRTLDGIITFVDNALASIKETA